MSNAPSTVTTTPATTTPSALDTDVKLGATAIAGIVAVVVALDPPAAAIGALVAAILAASPAAVEAIEAAIAAFKGNAQSTAPIAPQVDSDMAEVQSDLSTPIAPASGT